MDSNIENNEESVRPERTKFSDFVIQCIRDYISELNIDDERAERIRDQELLVIPFGSVARGNASEAESDIDLFFIAKDSNMPGLLLDGAMHRNSESIDQYILARLAQAEPDIRINRSEIEWDSPCFTQEELIKAIETDNLDEEGQGGFPIRWVLGIILNIDPSLVILPPGVQISTLEEIRNRIREALEKLPKDTYQKLKAEIAQGYSFFVNYKKGSEDNY